MFNGHSSYILAMLVMNNKKNQIIILTAIYSFLIAQFIFGLYYRFHHPG